MKGRAALLQGEADAQIAFGRAAVARAEVKAAEGRIGLIEMYSERWKVVLRAMRRAVEMQEENEGRDA